MKSYGFILAGLCFSGLLSSPGRAQQSESYPADYADLVAAAEQEGKVSVYSPTDPAQSKALVDAFRKAYPKIRVEWNDIVAPALFGRVIAEASAGQMGGDVAWSAPDMQLKLVSMGYAVRYESPEARNLPDWAVYQSTAYATSVEPAVILYNKTLVPAGKLPRSHDELLKALVEDKALWNGKVATFDPQKSASGFLWSRSNERLWPNFWPFVKAFAAAGGEVYSSSSQFKEKVLSGELLMAVDMNGAYAREWAKTAPNLGVQSFDDFTLGVSRVAFVLKDAPDANAARVFLDFMLSRAGQQAVSDSGLPSVRHDIANGIDEVDRLSGGTLKPIALDQALIDDFVPKTRLAFLARWKKDFQ